MAKPSATSEKDKQRAQAMSWGDLRELWAAILANKASDWHQGKALEHLVIRGFELSQLRVGYPYDVPPGGKPLEQIDGLVYLGETPFLIECKDKDTVDIEAIAKLYTKLLRRPPATMGCVFVSGKFTNPALVLADYMLPHRITLWTGLDIERALNAEDFESILRKKYEILCMYGLLDQSPQYQDLEVTNE